jgi:hypothetical protein
MTLYYFKAKVSVKSTPPIPWIIDGREVLVAFTDKTWWKDLLYAQDHPKSPSLSLSRERIFRTIQFKTES